MSAADMKLLLTVISSVLLLAVAAFCLFRFLATFEPSDTPGMFMGFRIGYAVVGIGCVVGMIALVIKCIRK